MAKKRLYARLLVVLGSLALSYVFGKFGHPFPGRWNGFWDGPVGG